MKKNFVLAFFSFLLFSIFLMPQSCSAMVKKIILFDSNYNTLGSYTNNLDSLAVNVQNVSKIRFELGENLTKDSIYNFDSKFFITTLDNYASIDWNIVADCGHNFETSNYWGTGHQVMGSRSYFYYINSQFNFTAVNNCTTPFYEVNLVDNFHVTNIGVDHINATFVSKETNLSPVLNGQTEIKSKIDEMISYQDKLTQDTIDNYNKNTDKIIEDNKKNFNDCRKSNNLFDFSNLSSKSGLTSVLNEDGSISFSGTPTSNYVQLVPFYDINNILDDNSNYTISQDFPGYIYLQVIAHPKNSSLNTIYYSSSNSLTSKSRTFKVDKSNYTYTISLQTGTISSFNNPNFTARTFKFMFNKGSSPLSFDKPGEEICKNRLDSVNDSINETNQSIKDLDSTLKDDSDVDIDKSFFEDFEESNTPISDLMTMPLTLLQKYLDGFNGTCESINLGSLLGTDLIMPCIDIKKYIGNGLWTLIDSLFSLFLCYNIAMLGISIYESITQFEDGMNMLYTPQHSGHSRVSRNEGSY